MDSEQQLSPLGARKSARSALRTSLKATFARRSKSTSNNQLTSPQTLHKPSPSSLKRGVFSTSKEWPQDPNSTAASPFSLKKVLAPWTPSLNRSSFRSFRKKPKPATFEASRKLIQPHHLVASDSDNSSTTSGSLGFEAGSELQDSKKAPSVELELMTKKPEMLAENEGLMQITQQESNTDKYKLEPKQDVYVGSRGRSLSSGGSFHWQPLRLADPSKLLQPARAPPTGSPAAAGYPKKIPVGVTPPNARRSSAAAAIFRVEGRHQLYKLESYQSSSDFEAEDTKLEETAKPSRRKIDDDDDEEDAEEKVVPMALDHRRLSTDAATDSCIEPLYVTKEKHFKVLLIGDPNVGKTSFVQRYANDTFRQDYKGTVGVDFALKVLRLSGDTLVKLQLWDVAGQERFTWMTRVYYRDARGCIIMFDLTNRNSFENIIRWKEDLDSKVWLPDGSKIPCLLLANKCDLKEREVEAEEIERLYSKLNFIGWTETSAKDDMMVKDSVKFLVDSMIKNDSSTDEATEGQRCGIITHKMATLLSNDELKKRQNFCLC